MFYAEYNEQVKLFQWAHYNSAKYPCLAYMHASTAGERFKGALQGYRAKMAGMRKGVPDIFLPHISQGFAGLFIELKRPITKGKAKPRVTPEQKQWIDYLNGAGYYACVCYGAEQAVQVVESYINPAKGAGFLTKELKDEN